jgi:hypothetical protein
MADRLVLNTVGIKSPLDVRAQKRAKKPARGLPPTHDADDSSGAGASSPAIRGRRALKPKPVISSDRQAPAGAPKLTAIELDQDLARKLDSTARAAGVPASGLAVAALDAALAKRSTTIRTVDKRRGPTARTTPRTLPLPPPLRSRADRLSATVQSASPGTARSELINTAIRRGLPDSPRLALALVLVAATAAPAAS